MPAVAGRCSITRMTTTPPLLTASPTGPCRCEGCRPSAEQQKWLEAQAARPGPITDAHVEAALAAWVESALGGAKFDAMADYLKERNRPRMRAALEAARTAL